MSRRAKKKEPARSAESGARYDLDINAPSLPYHRVYPPIGTLIGVTHGDGRVSMRYGARYTPMIVDDVTATHLYAHHPGSGLLVAFSHKHPLDWQFSHTVTFWRRCGVCKGTGGAIMGGEPCPTCATLLVPDSRCKTCAGWRIVRGSTFLVSCLACDGLVDLPFDPFEVQRPVRGRGRRARPPAAPIPPNPIEDLDELPY